MTKPNKVVNYPISGSPDGGTLYLFYGLPSACSNKLVLMSAGFPDDEEIFIPFASKLSNELGAFVGVTCLPGYHDDGDNKSWTRCKKTGYTFDEMANAFREASKVLRKEYSLFSSLDGASSTIGEEKAKNKFIGIFHDWGVVPGLIWANRAFQDVNVTGTIKKAQVAPHSGTPASESDLLVAPPDELVLFDVLLPPHPETENLPLVKGTSVYEIFIALSYRGIFALCFMVQLYVGKVIGVGAFVMGMIILKVFQLSPTHNIDAKVIKSRKPPMDINRMIYMMYPYYQMFKSMLTSKGRKWLEDATLPKDLSQMPVLYMYGTDKRIMFHDYTSKKILEREHEEGTSKSNAIAVDNAGHWLYSDLQKFQFCFDCVVSFVNG